MSLRLLLVLSLFTLASARADVAVLGETTTGDPGLLRPVALAMAPGDVLLIGDDVGKQVVGVQLPAAKAGAPKVASVAGLGAKVAEVMGDPRARIIQMCVSAGGDRVFLLVPNYRTRKMVILQVDAAGTLTELDLTHARHAKQSLPIQRHQRMAGIHAIGWAGDRVIVTGSTTAQFDANILALPAPLGSAEAAIVTAETYHWTHRKWETRAPVRRFCLHTEGEGEAAKTYLFGGYICTPIVRFDLSELKAGAKLRGSTITDFGGGEVILDIFTYEKDGQRYLLANTMRRGCVRIQRDYMMQTEQVNEQARALLSGSVSGEPVSPQTTMVAGFAGVRAMVKRDATHALVLRPSATDAKQLDLVALPLP